MILRQERFNYLQSVVNSSKSDEETKNRREGLRKVLNVCIDPWVFSLQGYKVSDYKIYEGAIYNQAEDKVLMFIPKIRTDINKRVNNKKNFRHTW